MRKTLTLLYYKDQSDTCCGYKTGHVPVDEVSVHVIVKKEEAQRAKATTKDSGSPSRVVLTMKLQ